MDSKHVIRIIGEAFQVPARKHKVSLGVMMVQLATSKPEPLVNDWSAHFATTFTNGLAWPSSCHFFVELLSVTMVWKSFRAKSFKSLLSRA